MDVLMKNLDEEFPEIERVMHGPFLQKFWTMFRDMLPT